MIMCCWSNVEKFYFLHTNVVIEPQAISNRKNLTLKILDEKTGKLCTRDRKPPEMVVLYGSYQDEVFPSTSISN